MWRYQAEGADRLDMADEVNAASRVRDLLETVLVFAGEPTSALAVRPAGLTSTCVASGRRWALVFRGWRLTLRQAGLVYAAAVEK